VYLVAVRIGRHVSCRPAISADTFPLAPPPSHRAAQLHLDSDISTCVGMGDSTDLDDSESALHTTTPQNLDVPHRTPRVTINISGVSPPQNAPIFKPGTLFTSEPAPISHISPALPVEEQPLSQASPNLLAVPGTSSRSGSLGHLSISSYDGDTLVTTPSVSTYGSSQAKPHKLMSFREFAAELGDEEPLEPDPGMEHHFHVEDNPFAFSPGQLSKLFNPTSLSAFSALGGLQGIVHGLRTNSSSGLSLDETLLDGSVNFDDVTLDATTTASSSTFPSHGSLSTGSRRHSTASAPLYHGSSELYADRKRVFGTSRLPERKSKTLLHIMWMTFNDKVLIILTVVAAISLALGLYQDFGSSTRFEGPKVRWVEGVTIMVAVALVVVVGSVNDYEEEKQFIKLSEKVRPSSSCSTETDLRDRRQIVWSKRFDLGSFSGSLSMMSLLEMFSPFNQET
jgi:P-type Ca2+ transporter type 2C